MNWELASGVSSGASPFMWSYRFDGSGVATPLHDPDKEDLEVITVDGFWWVHLNLADTRSKTWLRNVAMPDEARTLLVGDSDHVCLHGEGPAFWGVFSDFGREPGETTETFTHVRLAVGANFVITARRHPVQCAQMTRRLVESGRTFARPTDLGEAIISNIIAGLENAGEKTIGAINEIEDRVLDDMVRDDRRKLGPLRRRAVTLHRQTTSLQRVLARFDDPARLSEPAHLCLRRLLQRLESIHHELHATLERARLLHEEVASKLTAETNRQLYVLTVISTLILPPTFITGMFGMNVKGLLFADDENGFVYAMLLSAATAIAAYGVLFVLGRGARDKKA